MSEVSTGRRSPSARPARPRAELTVRRREQVRPHTVRLVVGGPGIAKFRDNEFTDKYVKIYFEREAVTRTYTVRRYEPDEQQLTIDFVTHGDHGLAAPWAAAAEVGERIVLSGAGGAYRPAGDAAWYLFAGDESAVPAVSSALEALPATARGVVILETTDGAEHLDVTVQKDVEVRWLHHDTPGSQPHLLATALQELPWPPGPVDAFVHGERESMKAARAVLRQRLGPEDRLSLSGYWAAGRTEDVFQAEKRLPVGKID